MPPRPSSTLIPIDIHIYIDDANQVIVTEDPDDDRIENLNTERGHIVVHVDIPKHLIQPVRVTVPQEVFGDSDTRIARKVLTTKEKKPVASNRMEMVIEDEETPDEDNGQGGM